MITITWRVGTQPTARPATMSAVGCETQRIQQLNEYLWDHLGETYSLARQRWLAAKFGLSRVYVTTRIEVVRGLGAAAFSEAVMVPPKLRAAPWVPPAREKTSLTDDEREQRLRAHLAATPPDERHSIEQLAHDMGLSRVFVSDIVREVNKGGVT